MSHADIIAAISQGGVPVAAVLACYVLARRVEVLTDRLVNLLTGVIRQNSEVLREVQKSIERCHDGKAK